MFSTLTRESNIYMLEKGDNPRLRTAQVTGVNKTQLPYAPGITYDQTVDVSVTADGESITFEKLPANADIASSGKDGIIVACTPEAMTSEVMALVNLSRRALESVHMHELFLERSDDMLKTLNPRYAEERRREEKIASLENKIGGIEESIRGMRDMLSSALGNNENRQS